MITTEEIEKFKKAFVDMTKEWFLKHGELRANAMLMNESFEVFPVLMPDPENIKQVAEAIRALCRQHQCVVACIAMEFWVHEVEATPTAIQDFKKLGKMVSELPEKKEVVTIYMETLAGAEQFLYNINRPDNNLVNETKAKTIMDVFANILPR
jgi:hypothetical protein